MKQMKQKKEQPKQQEKPKRKVNKTVVVQSILALMCLVLAVFVNWLFFIPVAILIWLNQRELFGKK